MDTETRNALATKLSGRLNVGVAEWRHYTHEFKGRSWNSVNSLAYFVTRTDGLDELLYVDGSVDITPDDTSHWRVTVCAFTEDHFLYYDGVPGDDGVTWKVMPRSRLVSIEVLGATPVIAPLDSTHSPKLRVKVAFRDGPTRELPFPTPGYNRDDNGLEGLVESLWADL